MEPYIGEVRLFAGNYAPRNWALCDGRLLSISENEALFALIGTTYGGDGRATFALPDLRGRIPVGQGQGSGLSRRTVAESFGTETVSLTISEMPSHNHLFTASRTEGTSSSPVNAVFASNSGNTFYATLPTQGAQLETMSHGTISSVGGSRPHDNVMPSLAMNYIIALFGIFPTDS